jgi:hypothetical protein
MVVLLNDSQLLINSIVHVIPLANKHVQQWLLLFLNFLMIGVQDITEIFGLRPFIPSFIILRIMML